MKKSDKQFAVTVGGTRTEVGTRSGVANFVREHLGSAEAGKDINLTIHVSAAPEAPKKEKKADAPAATETPAAS